MGYFYSFLAWLVGLSHIHSLSPILQICHSLLEKCHWFKWHASDLLAHRADFCHTFSLWQIEGLWNSGSPRILGIPDQTFWKIFGWQVCCDMRDSPLYHITPPIKAMEGENQLPQILLHLLHPGVSHIIIKFIQTLPTFFSHWKPILFYRAIKWVRLSLNEWKLEKSLSLPTLDGAIECKLGMEQEWGTQYLFNDNII